MTEVSVQRRGHIRPSTSLLAGATAVGLLILWALIRSLFSEGLLFNQSVTIANDAWALFDFPAPSLLEPRSWLAGLKQFAAELTTLPADTRLMVVILGGAYRLFGVSDTTSFLVSIAGSLVTGVLLFVITRRWFGIGSGLLAALLWAVLPLDIFFSGTLQPVTVNLALSLLVVWLALKVYENPTLRRGAVFVFVAGVAMTLDWLYALGGVVLGLLVIFEGQFEKHYGKALTALFILLAGLLILPDKASSVLEFYYEISYVFENLYLVPPLLFALVATATTRDSTPGQRRVLRWIGVTATILVVAVPYLMARPAYAVLGASPYWLALLAPALILIAGFASRKIKERTTIMILLAVSWISAAAIGLDGIVTGTISSGFLATSRISIGLVFLSSVVLFLIWNRGRMWHQVWLVFALVTYVLASLAITNDYVESYVYQVRDTSAALEFIEDNSMHSIIYAEAENLYPRLNQMNSFGQGDYLVQPLDLEQIEGFPVGSFVLIRHLFLRAVLGIPPATWVEIGRFSSSDQQELVLLRIGGE